MLRKARLALALTSLAVAVFLVYQSYASALAISPEGRELIRLHIVAHSDRPYDQALKLKVRDAIVDQTGHLFSGVTDEREAEQLLVAHLNQVTDIADQVLIQATAPYRSQAKLGIYPFPERTYDNMTLPAGRYRALKVVLGAGQGHNWWCVLFPPLCFVSGSSGRQVAPVSDDSSGMDEEAQRVMAAGETQLSKQAAADDKVEVRFKVAEVWEKVRPRARALLSWRHEE